MAHKSEKLFKAIKGHLLVTYIEWLIYDQLFGSKERVELLNSKGANVFSILQNSILDNCALALSRLTDSARTGRYENLSISTLIDAVREENEELAGELQEIYEKLEAQVERFRKHRHKRIAHLDLDTATKNAELESYIFGDIAASFDLITELLNTYEYAYFDSRTAYPQAILPLGADGEALIRALEESDLYKEMKIGELLE